MSIFTVSSRYAKSLLDLAQQQGRLDAVKADIDGVIAVLRANPELLAVLKNPIIGTGKKGNVLTAVFAKKLDPVVLAFFHILVNKGRAAILLDIAREFVRGYNEAKGIVRATVTSAAPLSEANLSGLRGQIAEQIQAEIILSNPVDPALIGGFVVRVGDQQVDASIAGRLHRLEKHFVGQTA